MKLGYRNARSAILFLAGLLAIALNHTMDGYAAVFGISLIVSSAITLLYVFMRFDENINQKIVMEMIVDGFSGLVLFTYPTSDQFFLLIVFAFWMVFNGTLFLTSGLMEEKNKPNIWLYVLSGIMTIVLGFVILNYNADYMGSVLYLIGFTLIIYSGINLYLVIKNKRDIY
jgi:uncharacterized membrane protein HdeD (DUF308 family)